MSKATDELPEVPECTCAMTEASMRACEVHSERSNEGILSAWEAQNAARERAKRYSQAINGEWWSGASDYQERAVSAVMSVADEEMAGLRRANEALRSHAQELGKIAAKADGYALAAEVAEREVARLRENLRRIGKGST